MKELVKRLVKYLSFLYDVYYYVGSALIRFIGLFIKVDPKLILFVVYGGQRYEDSPRNIYEYMKNNVKYSKYKFVWAFVNPENIEVPDEEKIQIDTLKYFITALRAKYWITNSSASRGLNFAKKENVNVFFTHGMTGIKKIGNDIGNENKSFKIKYKENFRYTVIEGNLEDQIIKRAWNLTDEDILKIGLPRNDDLVHANVDKIKKLREKLDIPNDKKVILYAPTFREYNRDSAFSTFLKPPFDFDKWYREIGDEYVLLLTAHYEVEKLMDIPASHPFVINAFKYPYINDLILVSDLLISDYSSIIFDYSIVEKPIISYAYDYDIYNKERGIYDGYEDIFSHGIMKDEDSIIEHIKTMNYLEECEYTKKNIKEKYIYNCGNATELAVKKIFGE